MSINVNFFSLNYFLMASVPEPKVLDTILDHIGNTPMVRVKKIAKEEGLKCELCK